MAVDSCEEGQDGFSILVLPDEGTPNPLCKSQLALLGYSEVPKPSDSQTRAAAELNCQNHVYLDMEKADAYSPSIMDTDIENGNSGTPKANNEAVENLKIEGPLTRALQQQISLQIGEKFMQFLINDSFVLPKFTSKDKSAAERERVHETSNNRTRKYKRSASFNSRKVVLLFSVLSSMGTMILIYLTLRVRQTGDGSVHA